MLQATRTLPASTSLYAVDVHIDQMQTTYWIQAPNESVAVKAAVNKFMRALQLSRTHPGETLPLAVHVHTGQRPQSHPIEAN